MTLGRHRLTVSPDSDFGQNRGSSISAEAEIGRHKLMYNLYILKLSDNSYYIGSTENIELRLNEHSVGRVRSTRNNLPFKLIYTENFKNRSEAQSREYQIKKWKSRKAIERLIMPPSSNG